MTEWLACWRMRSIDVGWSVLLVGQDEVEDDESCPDMMRVLVQAERVSTLAILTCQGGEKRTDE